VVEFDHFRNRIFSQTSSAEEDESRTKTDDGDDTQKLNGVAGHRYRICLRQAMKRLIKLSSGGRGLADVFSFRFEVMILIVLSL
jgi:hypothetical protein